TDGTLPEGLTLDAERGILSGRPTQGGGFSFTVSVRDKDKSRMGRTFELLVVGGPDSNAPVITSVSYKTSKRKMTVSGNNFGSNPTVFVDGVAMPKVGQTAQDEPLIIKGLDLQTGPHVIVIQTSAGARSAPYTLIVNGKK